MQATTGRDARRGADIGISRQGWSVLYFLPAPFSTGSRRRPKKLSGTPAGICLRTPAAYSLAPMSTRFRFTTAGESHGPGLVAIVEGIPAGLELDREALDRDMARRQLGHGRGGRMKIETDSAEIRSGLRHGRTLGSPIAILVANRDYSNWEERMSPWPVEGFEPDEVHPPRPGHADLVGAQKYGHTDIRNVLERASARETAARVAAGSIARGFLTALGVSVHSHVLQIASIKAPERPDLGPADFAGVDEDPVRCLDPETSAAMVDEINRLRKANE